MKFLSEDSVFKTLTEYIDDLYANYAIMLNGEWGSGKTYFVKKTLIERNKSKKKAVYVSLFGVTSSEDISNRVVTSIIETKSSKKLLPFFNGGLKIVGDIAGRVTGLDSVKELDASSFSLFFDYGSYFFIFDDLERTSMAINDVLGYINYFVEQNEAKVLIVANDEEMGNALDNSTRLLKYFIASNNEIDWNTEHETAAPKTNAKSNLKPTLAEVERRMDFFPDERKRYLAIKEKLIGKTLYFQPNLREYVPIIFKEIINADTNSDFTKNCTEDIVMIMEYNEYYNLRTLQFSLSFFSRILFDSSKFKQTYALPLYENAMRDILKSLMWVSIGNKKGESVPEWASNGEFGIVDFSGKNNYQSYGNSFKFIYDYVYDGVYEVDGFIHVLQEYINISSKKQLSLQLKNLQYYWEMDDQEVESSIEMLFQEFKKNNGDGFQFQTLLSLLYELKDIGFECLYHNMFIEIMRNSITSDSMLESASRPYKFTNNCVKTEFEEILIELHEMVQVKNLDVKTEKINEILNFGDGWGEQFHKYYAENRFNGFSEGLLRYMDIDKLVEGLIGSKVKDISDFRRTLPLAYSSINRKDYSQDELDSLLEIKTKLSTEVSGYIKKYNIRLLIAFIDSILEEKGYDISL